VCLCDRGCVCVCMCMCMCVCVCDAGCSDGTIGPYVGDTDMIRVHKNMPVSQSQFDLFNEKLIGVLRDNGVSLKDQVAVHGVLDGFSGYVSRGKCWRVCTYICVYIYSSLGLVYYTVLYLL